MCAKMPLFYFYMGINIGEFLGSAACGYLGQKINWHYGFGLAGLLMVLGLVVLRFSKKCSRKRSSTCAGVNGQNQFWIKAGALVISIGFCPSACGAAAKFYQVTNYIMVLLGIASVVCIVWMGLQYEKEGAANFGLALYSYFQHCVLGVFMSRAEAR